MSNHNNQAKILIVDDHEENLVVLEKLLSQLNLKILKSTNGNDALSLTLQHEFALILLDVQMPEMDGYEVLEMLSWDERTRYIPVIFVTANYRDESHRLKGYQYGAVDYLYKPISETILLGKVKVFLELYEQKIQYKILQEKLESILNATSEGIIGINADGLINFTNPTSKKLVQRENEDLIGKNFSLLLPDDDISKTTFHWSESHIHKSCSQGKTYHEDDALFIRADGRGIPVEYKAAPLSTENGQYDGVVLVFSDITLRKTIEDQLTTLALYDHLTKLPNRILFEKNLTQAVARHKRSKEKMGLMFLDLDKFKQVNDNLGHDFGDLLLQEVGKRLSACIRGSDTVARLGGDEFAIILDGISHYEDAASIAKKIIEDLSQPFKLKDKIIKTSTSIGIATFPISGDNNASLSKSADLAMYEAKQQGRNTFRFYTDVMNKQNQHKLNLISDIRTAIEKEQFTCYYQPVLDLQGNKILSIEVLLRWDHPQSKNIMPTEFIPIADEAGLLAPLGEWTLKSVCEKLKNWHDNKLYTGAVSINLASSQLMQNNFITNIYKILADANLKTTYLDIEITEKTLIDNTPESLKTIQDLDNMGINIIIDNFGTGFSSLNLIRDLPIKSIKIDRAFIHDLPRNPHDMEYLNAIITLGHSLNLCVIAKGIEDKEQFAFLTKLRCNGIQGNYFCSPLTAQQLENFLQNFNTKS